METFTTISEILPYNIITDSVIVNNQNNHKSITAILELNISELNSIDVTDARHTRVIELINDFPDNTYVSIYYINIFKKEQIALIQKSKNEIINYIEKIQKSDIAKNELPIFLNFMAITIPVPVKKLDSISLINQLQNNTKITDIKLFKKVYDRIVTTIRRFSSGIGDGVFQLNNYQIKQFMSLLVNKKYMEKIDDFDDIFTSDFNFSYNGFFDKQSPAYIHYGDNYHTVLSQRVFDSESKLPENSYSKQNDIFHKEDLSNIPFIIQHSMKVISKREGIDFAKIKKCLIATRSVFAYKLAFLSKTQEGISPEELKKLIKAAIETVESSNHKFLIQSFQVHLWADSLEKLEDTYESFNSVVSNQYRLKREKYNLKAAFYSLFPGNESINPITTCLASYNVSDFLPIDLPRQNYPDKRDNDFVYFYTPEKQLLKYDMFSKSADNWNSVVCGGSGSGKSFLVNNLLFQHSVYDPQIAIVDYGGEGHGSYRNFVKNQKGTYIEISFDKNNVSINPFDGQLYKKDGEINNLKYLSLLATLERIVTSRQKDILNNELHCELQKAMMQYYRDKDNNIHNQCCLDEFANQYLNIEQLKILYDSMFMFISNGDNIGPYAHFVRASKKIYTKSVVAFDMAGLDGHDVLKNVIHPALLDMICTNIIGSKGNEHRRKNLIMDEGWEGLKGGSMQGFIERMFRVIRKANGQTTILTQQLDDVINSLIGDAIMANTSYFYFVGNIHNPESLRRAKAGAVSLTDYDIEKILNCRSKRDFHLMTPFFSGLLQLKPTKEFSMLATTDAVEKNILRKHMKKLGVEYVTPEVIKNARPEFI
jgi:hypothetical protein